jgi:hypothetical protein
MLEKLHRDLNLSWEHLRAIAKHQTFTDSISTEKKMKSAKFLTEAAERVKVLEVVHRRVINRARKLYLYMGMNPGQAESMKVSRAETSPNLVDNFMCIQDERSLCSIIIPVPIHE